jgi:hypothetical protein
MSRLPFANFYYTQEDEVFDTAKRRGFTWSAHRPHTIIGYALGNALNMGVPLAVYAAICRETGRPFVFPGSPKQREGLTDVTDARERPRQPLSTNTEWYSLWARASRGRWAGHSMAGDEFRPRMPSNGHGRN